LAKGCEGPREEGSISTVVMLQVGEPEFWATPQAVRNASFLFAHGLPGERNVSVVWLRV
jgi:hypothetical protein